MFKASVRVLYHSQRLTFWCHSRFSKDRRGNNHPCGWLPFGMGPHTCIGVRFAMLEIKVAMVCILQKFRFDICPETEVRFGHRWGWLFLFWWVTDLLAPDNVPVDIPLHKMIFTVDVFSFYYVFCFTPSYLFLFHICLSFFFSIILNGKNMSLSSIENMVISCSCIIYFIIIC